MHHCSSGYGAAGVARGELTSLKGVGHLPWAVVIDFIEENLAGNTIALLVLGFLVAQFVIRKMIKAAIISGVFLALLAAGIFVALGR